MPIYEFFCTSCSQVSEMLCPVGESGKGLVCPQCGSRSLTKRMSVTAAPASTSREHGKTCCGREERCDTPPCGGGRCGRDSE
ncbi:MAG: FmdB family zinc ribbon protein [Desulfomonilia bacterium]